MTHPAPCWRPLTDQLPIVGIAPPLKAAFVPSQPDTLSIQARSGASLPSGNLVLLATSKAQTAHWYQEAQVKNGVLTVSMAGFAAVAASAPEPDWTLTLGQITEKGLITRRLQYKALDKRLQGLNLYFRDARDLTVPPACQFSQNGQPYEAFPCQMGREGALLLQVAPMTRRYWNTVVCRLSDLSTEGGTLTLTARCPKTLEAPIGFALLSADAASTPLFAPATPVGAYGDTHQVTGVLNLNDLPVDTSAPYWLTCVVGMAGEIPLHAPLTLTEAPSAIALAEQAEGHPLLTKDGQNCYLYCGADHRPQLAWRTLPPGDLPATEDLSQALPVQWQEQMGCFARHLGGQNWQWELELSGWAFADTEALSLCLIHDKGGAKVFCPTTVTGETAHGCTLRADLTPLQEQVESCRLTNWQVVLLARQGERCYTLRLLDPTRPPVRHKRKQTTFNFFGDHYHAPIGQMPFAAHTVEATPFCSLLGAWQIAVADQHLRYYSHFDCRALFGGIRFGSLRLIVRCPQVPEGRWVGVILTHRYKLESDRQEYFFPLKRLKAEGDQFLATASVPLKQLAFSPLYWDIRMVFERDGVQYWSSVKAPFRSNQHYWKDLAWNVGVKGLFFGDSVRLNQAEQLFLYRTVGNRFALVCQEYSPYSGFLFRCKERLAMALYYLRRKSLLKQSIYLVYEKYCCMAQDNGFYFFQYCMEQNMEQKLNRTIYFVMDKKATDYKNLLPYRDHVIQFMSLKHMVYLLAARLLISSDSKAHAYAWRAKESVILPQITKNKRLVFLQHGVIALKRVEFYRSGTNSVNLFITSNQREHDIILNELGYLPEEVVITGLARWDVLKDKSSQQEKTHILVMPTWRNWLEEVSDETFIASDYYRNYMALLNSDRLAAFLEQYDVYLDFYIHPKFRSYIKNFSISGERVALIPFGSQPLNELMMECKLLVTDYSSVCWDVYYQGKPVIFYQFDLEQYNETQGSYIDMETELFGDRATEPEGLFTLLEEAAANGFQLKDKYAQMRESMYEYLDHHNSQRTCEEIQKRNW